MTASPGPVGQEIVLENDQVRVWHITPQPGETQPPHHHYVGDTRYIGRIIELTTGASPARRD